MAEGGKGKGAGEEVAGQVTAQGEAVRGVQPVCRDGGEESGEGNEMRMTPA